MRCVTMSDVSEVGGGGLEEGVSSDLPFDVARICIAALSVFTSRVLLKLNIK